MKRIYQSVHKEYLQAVQNSSATRGQALISSFTVTPKSHSYGTLHPRQKSLTNSLILNLIVKCGLSISLADDENFRAFVAELEPKFLPPCRQTVINSILPQMLQSQQLKLYEYLATVTDMSLTCDIWTDRRSHAYLGVTNHSFHNGKPESHLLAFQTFAGSHSGQKIADSLASIISESNITSKIRVLSLTMHQICGVQ